MKLAARIRTGMGARLALLALAFLLSGAGPALAERSTWRVGTLAPQGSGWARQADEILVPGLEQASEHQVALKVFWNGLKGDDKMIIQKMESGELQGAGLSGQGTVLVCGDFSVMELPFLFENYEEVDYVREQMTPLFDQLMEKNGYKLIAWLDQGFDQIYGVTPDIESLRGLTGIYFLTWMGPMEEKTFHGLGMRMYPVGILEVGRMMGDGIGDAMMGPAIWVKEQKLFAVFKYVNPVKMRYSPAAVVVTLDAWEGIPARARQRILASRDRLTRRFVEGARADERAMLEAMINFGVKEVTTKGRNLETLREKSIATWKAAEGDLFTANLLQEVQGHLADFRAGNRKPAPTAARTPAAPTPSAAAAPAAAPASGAGFVVTVDTIRQVQQKLKDMGYYSLKVDGIMGIRTFQAIKQFQKANGMLETGAIDANLLKKLNIK